MKRLLIIFLFFLAMGTGLYAQSKKAVPDLGTYPGLVGAIKAFPTQLVVLDVRPPELYSQGHLPKAINIPVGYLWYQHPTHNLGAVIVVYGRPASADSRQGSEILRLQGYQHVILFGSISKWLGPLQP